MSGRRVPRLVVGPLLVASLVLGGCGGDPKEEYCTAVKSHQAELGSILGGGGNDALIEALPIFEDLEGKAPQDLRDDWKTVVGAIQGLQDALDAAGVDPATYDRDHPPDGLGQADKDAIDAAARVLSSQPTVTALDGVQQQARDVCRTPLQV